MPFKGKINIFYSTIAGEWYADEKGEEDDTSGLGIVGFGGCGLGFTDQGSAAAVLPALRDRAKNGPPFRDGADFLPQMGFERAGTLRIFTAGLKP